MRRVVLVILVVAARAAAQFDQFEWQLSGNDSGAGSMTATTMHVVGPDGPCCCGPENSTYFETHAPVAGTVSVEADFVNLDTFGIETCCDAPAWIINGFDSKAEQWPHATGWPTGSYHLEFEVDAGDDFGLGVWSGDCILGPGIADFHDFTFTPHPWSSQLAALDPRVAFDIAAQGLNSLAAAGDVNADGVADFVLGSTGGIMVFSGADLALLHDLHAIGAGQAVSGASDVNGDGMADVIAGDPHADPGGIMSAGQAIVWSGADGTELLSITGNSVLDQLGQTVCGLGDVDGDGFGDVAVTLAKEHQTWRVWVVSGQTGAVLHDIKAPSGSPDFGEALAGPGDVDGDGFPDMVVGSSGAAFHDGKVYLYSGKSGALLHTLTGTGFLGWAAAGAGDVDGDGHADVVAGASNSAVVISGATGQVLLTVVGSEPSAQFGSAVAGGGDCDGDGRLDIVVGDWTEGPGGAIHVFDALDGTVKAVLGSPVEGDTLGEHVAMLGDTDGDGSADLVSSGIIAIGNVDFDEYVRGYHQLYHQGPPELVASGDLIPDTPFTLAVTDALAGQALFLVAGSSLLGLPFKGGLLVPSPEFVLPFQAQADGTAQLTGRWPAGLPTWWTVWMQVWAVDPAGPQGFSATDAFAASQL